MRPQCSVFIATSLDGFIARENGAIDWLDRANATVSPGEDCGYAEFMAGIDALVIGRKTFEVVCAFPEWPFGAKPVIVLSRSLSRLPANLPSSVTLSSLQPAALVAQLGTKGFRRLYVDGGLTIQSFLADGLIDDITLTTIPVLLGSGKPLFGRLSNDVALRHLSIRAFEFGFVQSQYRVLHSRTQ